MVAPGPETIACSHFSEYQYTNDISPEMSRDFIHKNEQNVKFNDRARTQKKKKKYKVLLSAIVLGHVHFLYGPT